MKTLLFFVVLLMCNSCGFKQKAQSDGFDLKDNVPDTQQAFHKHQRKCLRIKKGFMGYPIDNTKLLAEDFDGEVEDQFKYAYMIWVYTGFYDTQQMRFPFYVYPQTAKGDVMRKGCMRGMDLSVGN